MTRKGPTPTAFGKMLRQLRQQQGLTQAEIAKGLGVSTSFVAQLELGYRRPKPAHFRLLLGILDLSLEEVMALWSAGGLLPPAPEIGTSELAGFAFHIRSAARFGRIKSKHLLGFIDDLRKTYRLLESSERQAKPRIRPEKR